MTKKELIESIATMNEFPKTKTKEIFNDIFEMISDALAEGEDVILPGFGKFITKVREARKGRNPHTGESIDIPEKRTMRFKPSITLKNYINQ